MRHSLVSAVSFRSLLAALGVAAALLSFGPASVSAQASGRASASSSQAAAPSGTVNIQTASAEELQLLPGIGPSRADAIVAQRERRAFRRVEDLMRVRGVGRATFRRLRSMLTVEGPTTMAAPSRSSAR